MLSYDKIVEYTGVHRSRVRPALTSLFDAHLVAVDSVLEHPAESNASNRYVMGLTGRKAEAPVLKPSSVLEAAAS
jgi:hypothetical protein